MNIYWTSVLRNWDASLTKKLIFFVDIPSWKPLFLTNVNNKLNKLSKSNVVYQFSCSGCEPSYIGKTEQTLFERTKKHVTRVDSAIKGHLDNCLNVEHLFPINSLILNDVNTHEFRLNHVCHNTRIIDQTNNWNVLLFREAYHILEKWPILNNDYSNFFRLNFTYYITCIVVCF